MVMFYVLHKLPELFLLNCALKEGVCNDDIKKFGQWGVKLVANVSKKPTCSM